MHKIKYSSEWGPPSPIRARGPVQDSFLKDRFGLIAAQRSKNADGCKVRILWFADVEILHLQRMAGSTGRAAAGRPVGECPEWAANEGDPNTLDFNGFGDGQRILEFNA